MGVLDKYYRIPLEDLVDFDTTGLDPEIINYGVKYAGAREYAVSGWWKFEEN